MTLAIVLLAVLPSVFSDSAQCPGNTRAVDGYPNKCYLYSYQDQGMDWDAQNSYCHRAIVEGAHGRLFTPESKKELNDVQNALNPPQSMPDKQYYTDYIRYASPDSTQNVYASATSPHIIMPSELWASGQPQFGAREGADCTYGNYNWGLADYWCSAKKTSIICEFPAKIKPTTVAKTTITTTLKPTTTEVTTPRPTTIAATTTRPKHHGGGRKSGCNFNNKLIGGGWVEVLGEC